MKKTTSLDSYYKKLCNDIENALSQKCKNAETHMALCAMALSRYRIQFAAIEDQFVDINVISGYDRILTDIEHLVCDSVPITANMLQSYIDWCMCITKACENLSIGYLSSWRLHILSDVMDDLGGVFTDWLEYQSLYYVDIHDIIDIGIWTMFTYETSFKTPNPQNFNCYEYIRAKHSDIDLIGRKRDALEAKANKSQSEREEFEALAQLFLTEGKKYLREAFAERDRLISEYKPATAKDIGLTTKEVERVLSDIAFLTDVMRPKEDIRQRLAYYRTIDIACEV